MILPLGTRISNSTQNLKFKLQTFSTLTQMSIMFTDPCGVLFKTGTESGLNDLGKQQESV